MFKRTKATHDPPLTVRDVANGTSPHADNARIHIDRGQHQLEIVLCLASYLFPHGNPALAPFKQAAPLTRNMVIVRDTDAPPPPQPLPQYARPPADMADMERWWLGIRALVNACAHERHGCVLTVIFFSLFITFEEIANACFAQLSQHGESDGERHNIINHYVDSQFRQFLQAPMNWENAPDYWRSTIVAISQTLLARDYRRMQVATQTNENNAIRLATEARLRSLKKRAKKAGPHGQEEAEFAALTQTMRSLALASGAPAAPAGTPNPDDDDDSDDEDDDILDPALLANVLRLST